MRSRALRAGRTPLLHRRRNQRPPRRAGRIRVSANLLRPALAGAGPHRRRRRRAAQLVRALRRFARRGRARPHRRRLRHRQHSRRSRAPRRTSLVGIAASGRTPYVLGALLHAALPEGLHHRPGLRGRFADLQGRRPHDRAGHRPRSHHRIHPHEGRHRHQDGPEHALHRRHDPHRRRLRQPDGQRQAHQRQAHRPRPTHHHGGRPGEIGLSPPLRLPVIEAGSVKTAIAMHKLSLPRAAAEERLAAADGSLSKALRDRRASAKSASKHRTYDDACRASASFSSSCCSSFCIPRSHAGGLRRSHSRRDHRPNLGRFDPASAAQALSQSDSGPA